MKFIIGTAQIQKNYGLLKNNIKTKEIIKIINEKKKNIDFVDTAPSYGNSERVIGKNINKKIKIITKLDKLISKDESKICREIHEKIFFSYKRLKKKKIYCLLFHREQDIEWLRSEKVKKKIKEFKEKNIINKVGVSCYDYKKIIKYQKIYHFDIFQIPLNIFNINKKKINYLKKLKKKFYFKIHARSIFLQGLVFVDLNRMPKKFFRLKNKILLIKNICSKNNVSFFNFLISAIDHLNLVDCAIIGLKSYKEFELLKKYKKIEINKKNIFNYKINDKKLTDPRLWKY